MGLEQSELGQPLRIGQPSTEHLLTSRRTLPACHKRLERLREHDVRASLSRSCGLPRGCAGDAETTTDAESVLSRADRLARSISLFAASGAWYGIRPHAVRVQASLDWPGDRITHLMFSNASFHPRPQEASLTGSAAD
jgi:hypothetical protein